MSAPKQLRVLVQVDGETLIDVDEPVLTANANIETPVERIWFRDEPETRHTGDVHLTIDYARAPTPWRFERPDKNRPGAKA